MSRMLNAGALRQIQEQKQEHQRVLNFKNYMFLWNHNLLLIAYCKHKNEGDRIIYLKLIGKQDEALIRLI